MTPHMNIRTYLRYGYTAETLTNGLTQTTMKQLRDAQYTLTGALESRGSVHVHQGSCHFHLYIIVFNQYCKSDMFFTVLINYVTELKQYVKLFNFKNLYCEVISQSPLLLSFLTLFQVTFIKFLGVRCHVNCKYVNILFLQNKI